MYRHLKQGKVAHRCTATDGVEKETLSSPLTEDIRSSPCHTLSAPTNIGLGLLEDTSLTVMTDLSSMNLSNPFFEYGYIFLYNFLWQ